MDCVQATILGILQGFLEWLPISSEGNLIIIMKALMGINADDALGISIFLHLGTVLAAIVFYRKDLIKAVTGKDKELLKFLVITTILSIIIGGALYFFVKDLSATIGVLFIAIIGISLIITGLVQWSAKKREGLRKKHNKNDSIMAGLAQGLAIIPGLSRSGMTTSILLLRNINARQALRLSFLMSIPGILIGQIGLGLLEEFTLGIESVFGLITAFIVGLLTIGLLTKIVEKINFSKFTIVLGVLALLPIIFL
jgi:undecaprenyl-diphosphatase